MAPGIPARLTRAEGRKFGLTVGLAFLALTGLLWWRDKATAIVVTGSLGGLLVVAGLVVPTYLGPVQRAWMGFAHLLSKVTTPIFMSVVYFVVLTPTSAVMRLFGRRPMVHREGDHGFWAARSTVSHDMERQF